MAHYNSLNDYLRRTFGGKVYKLALNGGMTCPNRDGTLDTRGCIFCSTGGSGDFAPEATLPIPEQIRQAKALLASKVPAGTRYIAYFQAYTNTYAPVDYLRRIFTEAMADDEVVALSIATRPDCLPIPVLDLLSELNHQKPIWIELGLQTIHPKTRKFCRIGNTLTDYDHAMDELTRRHISVITHVILGLPDETREDMLATVQYAAAKGTAGIKLQFLHVLRGTDLATEYENGRVHPLPLDEYIDLLIDCIEHLPPHVVIHRITGDGPKSLLLAPEWSANKKAVLAAINRELDRRGVQQGKRVCENERMSI